ncbi:MAG TPA: preprotein translocase subunit SecE [Acidimicrobiales bacterium]|nr:preprotein translocase subunit SecE [Acidimicrobiales bacterium]
MNRQYKRAAEPRGGLVGEVAAAPVGDTVADLAPSDLRGPAAPPRRTTPRQFLHEVNVEMRKVAWPTKASTVNYSTVVLVTLAILMALIFALDLAFSKAAIFLFK